MTQQTIPAPLTEAQVAQYYREGYLVVPGLVPSETIDRMLAAAPGAGEGSGWTATAFRHEQPDEDAALHQLLVEPHVVAAVEQIFEAPARVFYGMLAIVPAHGGTGLPWHQDNQYGQVLNGALNTFIALCDITPDKAILWVSPRSHLRGVQPSQDSLLYGKGHREAAVEPDNGIPLPPMKKGDACIFDRSTYHRSLQNETDQPRFAYAAQYIADYARMADTGEKSANQMRAADLRRQWQQAGLLEEASV